MLSARELNLKYMFVCIQSCRHVIKITPTADMNFSRAFVLVDRLVSLLPRVVS